MNEGKLSSGFEPIGAWLDAHQTESIGECIVVFCEEPAKRYTKYCLRHQRCFYRNNTPFNGAEQREIAYYKERQWEDTPEPPDDWELKHQESRWGT